MKKIVAIIRPEKLEELKEAFLGIAIKGMTVSQVHGCGNQHGWVEYHRGNEVIMNMLPKIKIEVVVAEDNVERVIDLILDTARTGEAGDGKIFVFPVDEVVRIRTGERGNAAL